MMKIASLFFAVVCLGAAPAVTAKDVVRDCTDCPGMIPISAGKFFMGSSLEALDQPFLEPDRVLVEQPRQQISIGKDFLISQTEITVAEYSAFADATGRNPADCLTFNWEAKRWDSVGATWLSPGFDQAKNHPVVCVNWDDATAYAAWLSEITGEPYRLPSEAEWEYSARAGSESLWYWGDEKDQACDYANASDRSGVAAGMSSSQAGIFDCDDGFVFTAPADFGKPNAFGLHGVIGNAGEWTEDCMVRTLEGIPLDGSPRQLPDCIEHVMRGGSWFNPPMYSRSAFRYGTLHSQAFNLVGFRVARDQTPATTGNEAKATEASARIKRLALRVPDLDVAIPFFANVVGFTLNSAGTMQAGADPYLYLIYNIDSSKDYRRALFDTTTEARGLFVLEDPSMAVPQPGSAREFAMVLETDDLRAMEQRAAGNGFSTEPFQIGSTPDGSGFAEMIVHGPGNLLVLAFEYGYTE